MTHWQKDWLPITGEVFVFCDGGPGTERIKLTPARSHTLGTQTISHVCDKRLSLRSPLLLEIPECDLTPLRFQSHSTRLFRAIQVHLL
jgi:hypothetical protein